MKTCYIMGAMPTECTFVPRPGDLVIAADGGLATLESLGIAPDVILGDFDSLGRIPDGEGVILHPVEKDDTDTMLAVKYALEKGYKDIWICCALGGRLDHLMANIQSGAYIANAGGRAHITGENEIVTFMPSGQIEFEKKDNLYGQIKI